MEAAMGKVGPAVRSPRASSADREQALPTGEIRYSFTRRSAKSRLSPGRDCEKARIMKSGRILGASAALVLLSSAAATAQNHTEPYKILPPVGAVDGSTQSEEIAIAEDPHTRMTVSVSLDGSGPYDFLVDTGADRSAVSRQIASHLQLLKGRQARLHSVTGAAFVETAKVSRLQVSNQIAPSIEVALLDKGAMGADGIIGIDALRSQRVMFDFRAGTMTIAPSRVRPALQNHDPNTIVVTGRLREGRLLLTKAKSGGRRIQVVVDTGSEMTIGNQALRDRLTARGQLRPVGQVDLQSVTGGKIPGEIMALKKLEIGGVVLQDLLVVFADAHSFKQLDLDDRPALLLGMNAMRAFDKVSIDFANRTLRLLMPEKSELGRVMVAQRGPARALERSPAGTAIR